MTNKFVQPILDVPGTAFVFDHGGHLEVECTYKIDLFKLKDVATENDFEMTDVRPSQFADSVVTLKK